jgi:hypothetical protein
MHLDARLYEAQELGNAAGIDVRRCIDQTMMKGLSNNCKRRTALKHPPTRADFRRVDILFCEPPDAT